jgi:hypothetical protein
MFVCVRGGACNRGARPWSVSIMPRPTALLVLVLLLLGMVTSGFWLWHRLAGGEARPTPRPSASMTPALPTPTPLRAPSGYRLAGVAVGDPESFAVIEAPDGRTTLYREDADVPGLGRLARIEAQRVIVEAEGGQFELWLAPAATPTRARTAAARSTRPRKVTGKPRLPTPAGTVHAPKP